VSVADAVDSFQRETRCSRRLYPPLGVISLRLADIGWLSHLVGSGQVRSPAESLKTLKEVERERNKATKAKRKLKLQVRGG
jgi:hypothetical protein